MTEYELYIPLHFNDGRPIPAGALVELKQELVDQFGGLTHFPQENEGLWKIGSHTFRDRIVILRVLSEDDARAERIFSGIKKSVSRKWNQDDVLIVKRKVATL